MKVAELRNASVEEIRQEIESLLKEHFNYRMQHSTGQLGQSHLLKRVKKEIARAKTVLNEKEGED